MEVNYPLLAEQIRKWRELRGYSQQWLAELADLSTVYMSQIENGHKKPTLRAVLSLAEALEVPLSDLLVGNQIPLPSDYKNEMEIILSDCTTEEKQFICEVSKQLLRLIRQQNKEK